MSQSARAEYVYDLYDTAVKSPRTTYRISVGHGWRFFPEAFNAADKARVPVCSLDERLRGLQVRIAQLRELPANWDLHGAKPIDPTLLVYVTTFLHDVLDATMPLPQIVPRVRGSLQLEWHTKSKDLEIYLDAPKQGTFLFEDVDQAKELEGNIRTDLAELKKILQELDA